MSADNRSNQVPDRPKDTSLVSSGDTKNESSKEKKESSAAKQKTNDEKNNPGHPSHFQLFMHKHFPEAQAHDRWNLVFTTVIAGSTFLYMLFAGWQLVTLNDSVSIARQTFLAANKPSVGVNGIIAAHLSKDATGKIVVSQMPTEQTINLDFRVEIKNFGPVAAENFVPSWKVFIDGVQQRGGGDGRPSGPSTIFPGKSIFLTGQLGSENYQAVMDGTKTLELETTVRYDGPGKSYAYCEKERYGPKVNAFYGLGAVCGP